jgi:glycosyltransferase involved in cell wall biosynthesis
MTDVLISVLLPTRNRVNLVNRSVESLLSKSSDPSRVEILVAYDEDDLVSQEYFNGSAWESLIGVAHNQVCCCPLWGYSGLNRYYTTMAKQARGRWFMVWNDDAVMLTEGWDQHLANNQDFIGLLHMETENFKKNLTLFPLIPKVWLDLFGELSQHQLNDSWIQDICHEADAVREIPVTVFHDRFDVTGNNFDATFQDRQYNKKLYNHENMKKIRSEWAQRLKEYREQTVACEPTLRQN